MPSVVPLIIKLSGKTLQQETQLKALFTKLQGHKAIIVHGGGVEVDALLEKLKIETPKIEGIRVSSKEAMPYITGMLAGTLNKKLEALAQSAKLKALGLMASSGESLSLIKLDPKFGQVANVKAHDPSFLTLLEEKGFIPIISSIGILESELFNINADEVAKALAIMFKAPLIMVSDVKGVLDKDGNLIPSLDETYAKTLIDDGTIHDGMLVKVRAAFEASKQTSNVVILSSLENLITSDLTSTSSILGTVFFSDR